MRRSALALLLGCLLLVAGASALDGYDYYQTIEYAACDQETYQQDIVIHRSTGTAYNETAGGLETWHIYVGEHCREDYGDIRFTNSTGAELAYYLWPGYDSSSARIAVRLEGATSAGSLTAWYGNPSAATTSDADTLTKVCDFESAISGWTAESKCNAGTLTQSTSQVIEGDYSGALYCGTGNYVIYKSVSTSVIGGWFYDDGASPCLGGIATDLYGSAGFDYIGICTASSTTHYCYGGWTGSISSVPRSVGWHHVEIRARSDGVRDFYLDGGLIGSRSSRPTAISKLEIFELQDYHTIYFDLLYTRAYSATPPAATTFSGEQEAAAPPITAITATPAAGLAPLTVQFTDTSTGGPTSWSWSFGDGNTSSSQNPQHTYTVPGTYSVTLTATNEYGSTPATKLDYITVYGPITAQFSATPTGGTAPLTVQFTDTSAGDPTSWSWTFGDGNTSTAQNPQHTYTTAGAHTVTLTASHPYDSDTETKTAHITVAVLQPFPGLTNIPRDLAGNGLYTDINGNGRLDYNDLTIFFQHLAWAKTAQPIACFDFNGNGWLDYNDVITLFVTIMEEHT